MTTALCIVGGCWNDATEGDVVLHAGDKLLLRLGFCPEHSKEIKRDFHPLLQLPEVGVDRRGVTFDAWTRSLKDLLHQQYPHTATNNLQVEIIQGVLSSGAELKKLYDEGKTQCEAIWHFADRREAERLAHPWCGMSIAQTD